MRVLAEKIVVEIDIPGREISWAIDLAEGVLSKQLRPLLVQADSELSAIAHGRPPSDKAELIKLSQAIRTLYEGKPES